MAYRARTVDIGWAAYITPFLLPISFLWDLFSYWWLNIKFWCFLGENSHTNNVKKVQNQVKKWRAEGQPNGQKMCTARPSWMSISQQNLGYKSRLYRVKVDNLNNIVNIDREAMLVTVEPGITIGFLNRALVNFGLTLPIVPELDTLTIGGLVMGGGIESTSHKCGLFHHICTEYEIVTADGNISIANQEHNNNLFHAIPMR